MRLSTNIATILLFLSFVHHSYAQEEVSLDEKWYVNNYRESDFDSFINKDKRRQTDFKQLRTFLTRKTNLKASLEYYLETSYPPGESYITNLEKDIKEINKVITGTNKDSALINSDLYYSYNYIRSYSRNYKPVDSTSRPDKPILVSVNELRSIVGMQEQHVGSLKERIKIYENIRKSLVNVEDDIYECQLQIDSILAPELQAQKFKSSISWLFAGLILIVSVCFFYIIYKKSKEGFAKDLLSEYGLQFVTMFVLIIDIVLFGILGIIDGANLTTILSGIAGFILGKGKGTVFTSKTGSDGTQPPGDTPDKPQAPTEIPHPPAGATGSTFTIRTG